VAFESDLRRRVGEYVASPGGYRDALKVVEFELISLAEQAGSREEINEAKIIRAELLQKLGQLSDASRQLEEIDREHLTGKMAQGRLLIIAKLAMQRGDFAYGKAALEGLKDKLGPHSSSEINQVYLWRQAFTVGILGERTSAERLRDEHVESAVDGGFQMANNIIYARVMPALASGEKLVSGWSKWVDEIRQAGHYYMTSSLEFSGRLNHRGKSLCQTLLAESLVSWHIGNRHDAYRFGFVAALLLDHWNLEVTSEGVAEIAALVERQAPAMMRGIKSILSGWNWSDVNGIFADMSDGQQALVAFRAAFSIVKEIFIADARILRIYDLLDHKRRA
jgi:hypothetical protein